MVHGCEPWDFNNTQRRKGNYNGMNESKGCCNKTPTICLKVANFEGREGGLGEKLQIETRKVEQEKD